ncbi:MULTISPECIES: RQC-minor-2 family DNA-binding protein [Pontibacillus]|uniref:RQC-minor-2 family DNA-binding protein n=1 Tax=Pontibacillus chungwhensis TaxID=265426 RepID=A0ABY8V4K5_9BACI|nr:MULTISPECIES: RQC-minor-2 family DNA-binding protein [Pontibacillus]MCD5322225.1 hypothetical protein [Pontibacillus sp. HN14]WIF99519.1 RQC-minor-2 family DNA-binding protein [Pontibacillus chungwhensis]
MALRDLAYTHEDFPYLVFFPGGKKNKGVRSIPNKVRKESLSRIHTMVEKIVEGRSKEEIKHLRQFLQTEGQGVLPVLLDKEGDLYLGGVVKPELFLFRTFPKEHGIPIHKEYLFETKISMMSNQQLEAHVERLFQQYLYCAHLSWKTEAEWVHTLEERFEEHSLVQFAHGKKEELKAVEAMNRSNLLSQLKYPEDISFWRHRVEIVMRPFRSIPSEWLWSEGASCHHEKDLYIHSEKEELELYCEVCDYHVYLKEDVLRLEEEFDLEKAKKRIHTIERQFNDITANNELVIDKIQRLGKIRQKAYLYLEEWQNLKVLLQKVESLPIKKEGQPDSPWIDLFEAIEATHMPEGEHSSDLVWLSYVNLPSISMLKRVEEWEELLRKDVRRELERLKESLRAFLEENEMTQEEEFTRVNKHPLYWGEVEQVLQFVHDYSGIYPAHTITQVLIGKATNKIRSEKLDEALQFGAMNEWQEKDAMKALKSLEKQGFLRKLQKGFSLTDKAAGYVVHKE